MPEQTTGPSWTPEDVELVARSLDGWLWTSDPEMLDGGARAVLAALAEAGRLASPDPSATDADQ